MASASTSLTRLARELPKPEAEIMTMAFEAGLRQLWRERILGQYLRGEIPRDKAIESAGIDWVEFAEQQYAAMSEDLAWAQVGTAGSRAAPAQGREPASGVEREALKVE